MKSHEEFMEKYSKSEQELALSEGLGQKYGAPRRRAQERYFSYRLQWPVKWTLLTYLSLLKNRLRTEVSRDEQKAGKIDEILAELDFLCAEEQRKADRKKLILNGLDAMRLEEVEPELPAVPSSIAGSQQLKVK